MTTESPTFKIYNWLSIHQRFIKERISFYQSEVVVPPIILTAELSVIENEMLRLEDITFNATRFPYV